MTLIFRTIAAGQGGQPRQTLAVMRECVNGLQTGDIERGLNHCLVIHQTVPGRKTVLAKTDGWSGSKS